MPEQLKYREKVRFDLPSFNGFSSCPDFATVFDNLRINHNLNGHIILTNYEIRESIMGGTGPT